jgi:hypothetical protein
VSAVQLNGTCTTYDHPTKAANAKADSP